MAALVYDQAMLEIATQAINIGTDTLKVMLVTGAYTPGKADQTVNVASASEVTATNYAGGYGGAGRKSAARTVVKDASANAIRVIFSPNLTWTALGGALNTTVAAWVLIKEVGGNDTASRLICYWPLATPFPTNGVDFLLTFDATNGNIIFPL